MSKICPSCGKAELTELVPGVQTCPNCRKIFRGKVEKEEKKKIEHGEVQEGKYFMENTSLNPKYEICDCGITIHKEPNKRWIAVLLCHPPDFPNMKYIRISWWKKSINTHAGMFKIQDYNVIDNVIIGLKRIDGLFDETFNVKSDESIGYDPIPQRKMVIIDESELFDLKKRRCPKCGWKMKKSRNKRYYQCERCGEVIVMYEERPIIDHPPKTLPLSFSSNFPVNYYLPAYGITVKSSMADWKALVIIYAKENPEKKWLRFYWWNRNLEKYMQSKYSMGSSRGLKWDTKKGVMSPNIYDKTLISPIIDAIIQLKKKWAEAKEFEYEEVQYEEGKKLSPERKFELKKEQLLKVIPTMKNTKQEMTDWIREIRPNIEDSESQLMRNLKDDLFGIVQKIAREEQAE